MKTVKYKFKSHGDPRGQLVAIEGNRDIPFEIKRVYYLYDVGETIARGFHAHKKLQQILICVHGSCKIKLDNGSETETVVLDSPDEGLYVSNSMWREMYDFSPGAVLLVLASEYYDESDYIRDYKEFKNYISNLRAKRSADGE